MVRKIQEIKDYYNLEDDDYYDDLHFLFDVPDYYESDEQLVLIACLLLLEQRYRLLQSMTPERILDEIDEIISSLEKELTETASHKIQNYVDDYLYDLLDDYSIPHTGYVESDTSMLSFAVLSIGLLCSILGGEIKVQSKFYSENISKGSFNITPSFQRAVTRLNDAVGNNLLYSKEKTSRNVKRFVYGQDKLYRWLTANDDRVCSWCRMQESLPPRTIDEMPLDHPHGRCVIEPIDYTYSDEYYILLARNDYSDTIDAFAPEDEEHKWEDL